MQYNTDRGLVDEASRQVLLFLRSSKHFSVHEISRAIGRPMEEIWNAIVFLEKNGWVTVEKDGYKLSNTGSSLLLALGYNIPKQPEDKKTRKASDGFGINPFGSFSEFLYWMIVPSILIVLLLFVIFDMFISHTLPIWETTTYALALITLLGIYCTSSFRKVPEYENLVIFRLGKCIGKRGPGPVLILPIFDKPQSVDLRVKHQEVPHETCITQDNVQLDVDFVFYWKIQEPVWSITKVTDPEESIRLLATALLRAVIAHFKFNDVLNQRESINDLLKEKIDEISADWGVYVTTMEIREIKPPDEIVKSMHKQVSAEWQRKATVIEAEGEAAALKMLDEAATSIDEKTKSLKYYEMLKSLGEGSATKYVLPLELTNLAKGLASMKGNDDSIPPANQGGLPGADPSGKSTME
ncbi:MAG TPA: SPFH domain-containing protein [Anaerolineales bacterium]|nr:SPFH domain-containing protein [Anaerolineales bacterium]